VSVTSNLFFAYGEGDHALDVSQPDERWRVPSASRMNSARAAMTVLLTSSGLRTGALRLVGSPVASAPAPDSLALRLSSMISSLVTKPSSLRYILNNLVEGVSRARFCRSMLLVRDVHVHYLRTVPACARPFFFVCFDILIMTQKKFFVNKNLSEWGIVYTHAPSCRRRARRRP